MVLTFPAIEFAYENKLRVSDKGTWFYCNNFIVLLNAFAFKGVRIIFHVDTKKIDKNFIESFLRETRAGFEVSHIRSDQVEFIAKDLKVKSQSLIFEFCNQLAMFFEKHNFSAIPVDLSTTKIVTPDEYILFKKGRHVAWIRLFSILVLVLCAYFLDRWQSMFIVNEYLNEHIPIMISSYSVSIMLAGFCYFILMNKSNFIELFISRRAFVKKSKLFAFSQLFGFVAITGYSLLSIGIISNCYFDKAVSTQVFSIDDKNDSQNCYKILSPEVSHLMICSNKLNFNRGQLVNSEIGRGFWGLTWIKEIYPIE